MRAARAALVLLAVLLILPTAVAVFPGFFMGDGSGDRSPSVGSDALATVLLSLFLIGLVVRLGRRLRHDASRGREAAERRARVAPRYRAEGVPASVKPRTVPTADDPEFELLGD